MWFDAAMFRVARCNSIAIFSSENSIGLSLIGLSSEETTFARMLFLMESVIPPPFLSWSRRNVVPKPSKKNWPSGKEKSHLNSEIIKISIWLLIQLKSQIYSDLPIFVSYANSYDFFYFCDLE